MTTCVHLSLDGLCAIASQIAGRPVILREINPDPAKCCSVCSGGPTKYHIEISKQQAPNRVTVSLALARLKLDGLSFKSALKKYGHLLRRLDREPLGYGIGTVLHSVLSSDGYVIEPDCACLTMIRWMNTGGPLWCRENHDLIVYGMIQEWKRRHRILRFFVPSKALRPQASRYLDEAIAIYEASQSLVIVVSS